MNKWMIEEMVEQNLKEESDLFGRQVHIAGKESNVCKRQGDVEKHDSIPLVILGFLLKYSAKSTLRDIIMLLFSVFLMTLYAS